MGAGGRFSGQWGGMWGSSEVLEEPGRFRGFFGDVGISGRSRGQRGCLKGSREVNGRQEESRGIAEIKVAARRFGGSRVCWGEARRFREQRGGIVGRWETYEALGRYWEQQGGTGGQQGDIRGRGEIGATK